MKQFFMTTTLSQYLQENNLQFLLEIIYSLQKVFIVSKKNSKFGFLNEQKETNSFWSYKMETLIRFYKSFIQLKILR